MKLAIEVCVLWDNLDGPVRVSMSGLSDKSSLGALVSNDDKIVNPGQMFDSTVTVWPYNLETGALIFSNLVRQAQMVVEAGRVEGW